MLKFFPDSNEPVEVLKSIVFYGTSFNNSTHRLLRRTPLLLSCLETKKVTKENSRKKVMLRTF